MWYHTDRPVDTVVVGSRAFFHEKMTPHTNHKPTGSSFHTGCQLVVMSLFANNIQVKQQLSLLSCAHVINEWNQ